MTNDRAGEWPVKSVRCVPPSGGPCWSVWEVVWVYNYLQTPSEGCNQQ
jgi:hypothetical protein